MKIKMVFRNATGEARPVEKEIEEIKQFGDSVLQDIAEKFESLVRYMIENKSAGGTGNLANCSAWAAHAIVGGWAVGDVSELNQQSKYWRHQNWGSEGIGANWGHYLPKGRWENGRFVKDEHGYSGLKPQTPIPAMHYIEDAIAQLDSLI